MKFPSKDVMWYAGKRKNPIAYSTIGDSDAISIINTPNKTPNELMVIMDSGKFIVNDEMKLVIQSYIDKGFGDVILKTREL